MADVSLERVKNFALWEMDYWGITDEGYTFKINRNKRRLGVHRARNRSIEISIYHVKHDSWELVKDTIRHEIAHALDYLDRGTTDHSKKWKHWARKVGADPSSMTKVRERPVDLFNWFRVCPNPQCDRYQGYYRKPRAVRACGPCCRKYNGGEYHPDYKYLLMTRKEFKAYAQEVGLDVNGM